MVCTNATWAVHGGIFADTATVCGTDDALVCLNPAATHKLAPAPPFACAAAASAGTVDTTTTVQTATVASSATLIDADTATTVGKAATTVAARAAPTARAAPIATTTFAIAVDAKRPSDRSGGGTQWCRDATREQRTVCCADRSGCADRW